MTPQAKRAPALPAGEAQLGSSSALFLAERTSGEGGLALRARLAVVTLAQVIRQLVADDGPANNGVGAVQGNLF